jgi:hypothetical protein
MLTVLLPVVRDILREELQDILHPESIHVTPDGRPYPVAGQRFLAIFGFRWSAGEDADMDIALDESVGFECALSVRAAVSPVDRVGPALYIKEFTGMEAIHRRIIRVLDKNLALIERVNAELERQNYPERLIEYPRWLESDASPVVVGADWFWAEAGSPFEQSYSGLVMSSRFYAGRFISYGKSWNEPQTP